MLCRTFLPLHFGQATLPFPYSETLRITVNFFLQSLHSYSYVGISILRFFCRRWLHPLPSPPGRGEGRWYTVRAVVSVCLILMNWPILSREETNPSEIFISACIFGGKKRAEGLVAPRRSKAISDPLPMDRQSRCEVSSTGIGGGAIDRNHAPLIQQPAARSCP